MVYVDCIAPMNALKNGGEKIFQNLIQCHYLSFMSSSADDIISYFRSYSFDLIAALGKGQAVSE